MVIPICVLCELQILKLVDCICSPCMRCELQILNNAKMAWTAWGELEWAVRTGGDPYERVNGQPVWEHFKANPEKEATFTRAMKSVSSLGTTPSGCLPVTMCCLLPHHGDCTNDCCTPMPCPITSGCRRDNEAASDPDVIN